MKKQPTDIKKSIFQISITIIILALLIFIGFLLYENQNLSFISNVLSSSICSEQNAGTFIDINLYNDSMDVNCNQGSVKIKTKPDNCDFIKAGRCYMDTAKELERYKAGLNQT